MWANKRITLSLVLVLAADILTSCAQTQSQAASQKAQLRVVLYPFIPEFNYAADTVKKLFEKENPDIELTVLDLSNNYYSPDKKDDVNTYIGNVQADVYELDSVFLTDFVKHNKIKPLPDDVLLPADQLLKNANSGSMIDGKRYGSAHWACGNFLFITKAGTPTNPPTTLKDLAALMGSEPNQKMMVDMKGRLTIGEFYLGAAYAKYKEWSAVKDHLQTADTALEDDLIRIVKMCPTGMCRDSIFHELTGFYGQEFANGRAKTLIGYSELLHSVLTEGMADGDFDVYALPLDDAGTAPISWVDSLTVDAKCGSDCFARAAKFIKFMQRDDVYMKMLLPGKPSYLSYPIAQTPPPVPAYLLPAKASLYSNADLVKVASHYPKLKTIIEGAAVPSTEGWNDSLRKVSADVDAAIKKAVPN
jgi:thiamine pyridinylase